MAARHYCAVLLMLGAASPALAAQCDFMAAKGDAQYTATNVGAAPASTAKVVMTLEARAPVEVHVTGRRGDWYHVDRITIVDKSATGWMAPDAQCSNPMTTCS